MYPPPGRTCLCHKLRSLSPFPADAGRTIYSKFILINIIIFPELISEEEWNDLDTIQFEDQFNYWNLEDPRFMARFSEQTWLQWNEDETGVLNDLRER